MFSDKTLEYDIECLSGEITSIIGESEGKLKEIVAYNHTSDTDKKVTENVQAVLAKRL